MAILSAVILRTGAKIEFDGEGCEDPNLQGYWSPQDGTMTLCSDNVKTAADADDLLKHESIHVAQSCKGGRIFPDKDYVRQAQEEGWDTILGYDPEVWELEAEARVLSPRMTAYRVSRLVMQECILNRSK